VGEAIRIDRDRYKGGFGRPFLRRWWCVEKEQPRFNSQDPSNRASRCVAAAL
jgi:hypothetical protein